jgi:hypothetical protein
MMLATPMQYDAGSPFTKDGSNRHCLMAVMMAALNPGTGGVNSIGLNESFSAACRDRAGGTLPQNHR